MAMLLISGVNAQEKPSAGPEAGKLMERAKAAKDAGRFDEARELAEQAHRAGAGKHDDKARRKEKHDAHGAAPERLEKARREIEELHRAGKHEEAGALKRRIAEGMEHKKASPMKEGEGPARLRHVMEAIRHLREAGLNEPAEGLEKLARGMREDFERHEQAEKIREMRKPNDDGPPRKAEGPRTGGDELRAIREQMEKMSRAIDELRAQVSGRGDEEVRKPRKD